MYKTYLPLFVFIFFFLSCKKESNENSPSLNNLISEIAKENPDCTCEPYIDQYEWKGQIVYVLGYKGPACDWFPTYYNENGVEFTMAAEYSLDDFRADSEFRKNVWNCK